MPENDNTKITPNVFPDGKCIKSKIAIAIKNVARKPCIKNWYFDGECIPLNILNISISLSEFITMFVCTHALISAAVLCVR